MIGAPVRTFLIADIRGYTRFTQQHGDEAAGELAAGFAERSRDALESRGGDVIELRGDEVLCVFLSAREALRAAVDLQARLRRATGERPAFPLPIGIGLDAGEAVPIEGGYRGSALNTASRLCSVARPGETLATETVVNLAQHIEGIRFVDRRPVRVKGLKKPVRVIEIVPEGGLPPLPEITETRRPIVTRRRLLGGAVIVLALLAVAVLAIAQFTGGGDIVPANSVAVIDSGSKEVVDSIGVGESPGPITVAGGAVWVANLDEWTLSRIDPATRTMEQTIGIPDANPIEGLPPALAGDADDLWVMVDCFSELVRMDPRSGVVVQSHTFISSVGPLTFRSCAVTAASQSVWATVDEPSELVRAEAPADEPFIIAKEIPLPVAVRTGITLGAGSVWVSERITLESQEGMIRRVDPSGITKNIPVDKGAAAVMFAFGAVWVVNALDNEVLRIDPETNSVVREIQVGQSPSAIAAGDGALWVTNTESGTVSRIDPDSREVTDTIEVGHRPLGIAFNDGLLWVTVRA
jgi:YVTN family beta-propeller protein